VLIETRPGNRYTPETWSSWGTIYEIRRKPVFDHQELPGSGSKIAPFNAKFYAIDHEPQL
jgi:hypothetical protein